MSDLVGNPEDRFSHNEAQMRSRSTHRVCLFYRTLFQYFIGQNTKKSAHYLCFEQKLEKIPPFPSENCHFYIRKNAVYLHRCVDVMILVKVFVLMNMH